MRAKLLKRINIVLKKKQLLSYFIRRIRIYSCSLTMIPNPIPSFFPPAQHTTLPIPCPLFPYLIPFLMYLLSFYLPSFECLLFFFFFFSFAHNTYHIPHTTTTTALRSLSYYFAANLLHELLVAYVTVVVGVYGVHKRTKLFIVHLVTEVVQNASELRRAQIS